MKLLFAVGLFCFSFINCKTHQLTYKKQMKEAYLYTFKLTYIKKMLTAGFNNSEAIKAQLAKDGSGYGEPLLLLEDYKIIDSFVLIDNARMIQDSINRIGKVAEGAQGKHVLTNSLSKFQSKWLDSLANARYRLYLKASNAK
ncbi:MAG TPA: hypothetical protein VF476_07390 [Chitinophagaceae bacterium]